MSEAPVLESAAPTLARTLSAVPQRAVSQPPAPREKVAASLRRIGARLLEVWVPRASWSLSRTGRPGLVGAALVAASAVFLCSTQLRIADEVVALKSDLATARARGATTRPDPADNPQAAIRALPARGEMPALLGSLLAQADAAHLTIDTGKYEMSSTKAGDIVRYKVSFPVTGPYPQVREFIDSTLKAMPSAAITDLSIERKTIGDGAVEAQIRLTVFTRSAP